MKKIEIFIKKKRRLKIKTKNCHIEQTIEPNYDWIKDKTIAYDDSEYTKENY